MKTIDGFCIKELRLRNNSEVFGKVSDYKKINAPIDAVTYEKLNKLCKSIKIKEVELLRRIIEEFTRQIHVEEMKYEAHK